MYELMAGSITEGDTTVRVGDRHNRRTADRAASRSSRPLFNAPTPRYSLAGTIDPAKTCQSVGVADRPIGERGSHMSRRTLFVASLVAAAAAVAVPAVARGEPPDRFHARFSDTVEDVDVCGINVDIFAEGVFTDLVFFDNDGNFDRFMSTSSGKQTLTADNGKSVVIQFSQQYSETEPIIDEAAGTITFVYSYKGLPEKISTPQGPVILRDAGLITFADTFDLDTGEFISGEIVVNRGPHPDADSDFVLFCEVITAALS
jgi:hypothetical protein